MNYEFYEKLEYSLGEREEFDINLLKKTFNWQNVIKTDTGTDKTGVDYIATLRRGGKINIDAKTRERGSSKWWSYSEPEVALEVWSVMPENGNPGKIGWALNEASNVDYILYTFDKYDTDKFYFLPFQLLRMAFVNNYKDWTRKYFKKKQETIDRCGNVLWTSECVFVPASVLIKEITRLMTGTVCQ